MAIMTTMRTRRNRRRVRSLLLGLALAAVPLAAPAVAAPSDLSAAIRSADAGSRDVRDFYATRSFEPLWIQGTEISPAAETLLRLIESAELDGLEPRDYRPRALTDALNRAAADPSTRNLAKAEMLLSRTYVSLARDMQRTRDMDVLYADEVLRPHQATARQLLEQASRADSLDSYLIRVGWMNPIYGRLRTAAQRYAAGTNLLGSAELRRVRLNLDRARALPADLGRRYVLVDAAAARLWMYEDGKVAGTMKVVVGKQTEQTPMMAALIRYAAVNPYWNLPPDLIPSRVAEGVLSGGAAYLKAKNYEVLSDWSDDARVVDPSTVDWAAVAAGAQQPRVRMRPGPQNPMGRVKFMFPNTAGVYLHDTPTKELLRENERLFSSGCVRLEDAPRLARWLFGKPLALGKGGAEQRVDLEAPVPVYITYLTTGVEDDKLVFRSDVYGRDELYVAGAGDLQVGGR